jgi:hypothetical protein
MEQTKIQIAGNTMDVSRVTKVTTNTVEGGRPTYTLRFDGFHDDTNAIGETLEPGKVGDHADKMPKDARGHVGNRNTFGEEELEAAGFFDVYNSLHPSAKVGPGVNRKAERTAAPAE